MCGRRAPVIRLWCRTPGGRGPFVPGPVGPSATYHPGRKVSRINPGVLMARQAVVCCCAALLAIVWLAGCQGAAPASSPAAVRSLAALPSLRGAAVDVTGNETALGGDRPFVAYHSDLAPAEARRAYERAFEAAGYALMGVRGTWFVFERAADVVILVQVGTSGPPTSVLVVEGNAADVAAAAAVPTETVVVPTAVGTPEPASALPKGSHGVGAANGNGNGNANGNGNGNANGQATGTAMPTARAMGTQTARVTARPMATEMPTARAMARPTATGTGTGTALERGPARPVAAEMAIATEAPMATARAMRAATGMRTATETRTDRATGMRTATETRTATGMPMGTAMPMGTGLGRRPARRTAT